MNFFEVIFQFLKNLYLSIFRKKKEKEERPSLLNIFRQLLRFGKRKRRSFAEDIDGDPRYISLPKERVVKIHGVFKNLQRRAACEILERFDIPYIPGPLLELLEKHDAPFAFYQFAKNLGLNYSILMDIYDPRQRNEKICLQRNCEILIELYDLLKEKKSFYPDPILISLKKRDYEKSEIFLKRLHQTIALQEELRDRKIIFPEYRNFRKELEKVVDRWEKLNEEDFDEAYQIHRNFLLLQETYDEYLKRTEELFASIVKGDLKTSISKEEWETILNEALKSKEEIEKKTKEGSFAARKSIEELENLISDLESLLELVEPKKEDKTSMYLRILGLDKGATLDKVRKAYRRMAFECHPDRLYSRKAPEEEIKKAEEKFKKISEANDYLTKVLK